MLQGRAKATVILVQIALLLGSVSLMMGQEMGVEAEMSRLEQRADELIAQGDAEGASLTIGKAAMMAGEISNQKQKSLRKEWYINLQAMFRTQEQVYRAIALFERAGGTPPASSGVCHELQQAKLKLQETLSTFQDHERKASDVSIGSQATSRVSMTHEWKMTVQDLRQDFGCLS